MNRYGNPARYGNLVTAQHALAFILIALLVLFVCYPTTTLYKLNLAPSSTVFFQYPDITLGTYYTQPDIEGDVPSDAVAKLVSLFEQLPPRDGVLKRGDASERTQHTKDIINLVACAHDGEVDSNENDELTRRAHLDQSSEVNVRRGDMPQPGTWRKPNRPSRPNRPKTLILSRFNSLEDFVGNHGPIASQSTDVSIRDARSERRTESTLGQAHEFLPYNLTTQEFTCPADKPNGKFCHAPGSNGIISCENGVGWMGSCGARPAHQSPVSMADTQCWETSRTSGDAACLKNCIVYPDDDRPSFPEPGCTPMVVPRDDDRNARIVGSKQPLQIEAPASTSAEVSHVEKVSERKDAVLYERGGPLPYNDETNTYECPAYNPNGRFCAGGHGAPIIIRCHNGVGQAGNCNNNLMGYPPLGNAYSPCWETSPNSGDAACSKNCIVYPEDGRAPFTLPHCTTKRNNSALEAIGVVDKGKVSVSSELAPRRHDPALASIGVIVKDKAAVRSASQNVTTHTECPKLFGSFCAGGNIIRHCHKGFAQTGNCNNNLAGYPPFGTAYSPCWETSPISGDAACSKNCIVYPENGKASFELPGCKRSLNGREIDEDSTELDSTLVPSPHYLPHKPKPKPKPKPRPDRPPPQGRIRTLESEQSFAKSDSGDTELDLACPPKGPKLCNQTETSYPLGKQKRTIESEDLIVQSNSGNAELDSACPPKRPKLCNNPETSDLQEDKRRAIESEESFAQISSGNVELDPARPPRPTYRPKNPRPKGPRVNTGLVDRSDNLNDLSDSVPGQKCRERYRSGDCKIWASDIHVRSEVDGSQTEESSHVPLNGPPFVIHSLPMQVENPTKDCRGKTGPSLDICRDEVRTNNRRILCIALVLGVLGLAFLSIVVLDKIRRAKSRRASAAALSKTSLKSDEQMSEGAMSKSIRTTYDGASDGWTTWLMQRREKHQQYAPAPRVNAPRIPSLTLPKPTLATVRKFSGLGPDMENMGGMYPKGKGRWNSISSKTKWGTTV